MTLNKQTRPIKEGGGGGLVGRDRHKPFPVVLNSNNQGSAIATKLPALSSPGDSVNKESLAGQKANTALPHRRSGTRCCIVMGAYVLVT